MPDWHIVDVITDLAKHPIGGYIQHMRTGKNE